MREEKLPATVFQPCTANEVTQAKEKKGSMRADDVAVLVVLGAVGLLLLAMATFVAVRARRPVDRRPPKRTFEHGRRLARLRAVHTAEQALASLREVPVGQVLDARADDRAADVVLVRKKNQPCPQAAGFFAGLFEAAWAHEVRVVHVGCAGERGGECRYHIQRAVSASGVPKGGASTPGSAVDRRRSPRVRAGGG